MAVTVIGKQKTNHTKQYQLNNVEKPKVNIIGIQLIRYLNIQIPINQWFIKIINSTSDKGQQNAKFITT